MRRACEPLAHRRHFSTAPAACRGHPPDPSRTATYRIIRLCCTERTIQRGTFFAVNRGWVVVDMKNDWRVIYPLHNSDR